MSGLLVLSATDLAARRTTVHLALYRRVRGRPCWPQRLMQYRPAGPDLGSGSLCAQIAGQLAQAVGGFL